MTKMEIIGEPWDVQILTRNGHQHVLGWPNDVLDEADKLLESGNYTDHHDMNAKLSAIWTANGHKVGLSPDFKYHVTDELIELMRRRGWSEEMLLEVRNTTSIKAYFAGGGGFVMVTDKGENGGYLSAIPFDVARRMQVIE